jgi:hypothetical protein
VVAATKIKATAGADNPAVFSRSFDNWTVVSDAFKPAQNAGLTLLVASLASDATATAVPGTTPSLAHNEFQTITSTLTTGTFTLTFAGQTTAAINWNDSAATVQTRLRDLSNIGALDVVCTGGPLGTNPVTVEFQSGLGAQDVALLTASTGSVTIAQTGIGHPGITFAWEGSVNCPRWLDGPAWEGGSAPQINFWTATPASYVAGTKLAVTASDHGANQTVSALLFVFANALPSNPISNTFGTAVGFLAQSQGTFGSITPAIPGSKILAVLGLSTAAAYTAAPNPTVPTRFARIGQIQSDRSVLDFFMSPPVAAAPDSPNPVQWTGAQDFVTGLMAIQPAGTAGSLTLPQVLADGSLGTWAEITSALGALYEVLEFDLSAIPANGVITAASLEIQHGADAKSFLRVALVAIADDGSFQVCSELRAGGYSADTPGAIQTITTGTWVETADGSPLTDFARLGVVLFSTNRNPAVTSHRVYSASLAVEYEPGGPVVSNVAHVQVRIRQGSGQLEGVAVGAAPANSLNALTGDVVFDSGRLPGSLRRSISVADVPLSRGPMTVNVRAWARLPSGREIVSDWATAGFDIPGSPLASGGAPAATIKGLVENGSIPPASVLAWMPCENPVGVTDSRQNAAWTLGQPDASNNPDGTETEGGWYPNVDLGSPPYSDADYHFLTAGDGPAGSTGYLRMSITDGFATQHAAQWWRRWLQATPDNSVPIPYPGRVNYVWLNRLPQALTYANDTGGGAPYGFTNDFQLYGLAGLSGPFLTMGAGRNLTHDTVNRWHVNLDMLHHYDLGDPAALGFAINEWSMAEAEVIPDSTTPVYLAQVAVGGTAQATTASFTPPAHHRIVVVAWAERSNHATDFAWAVSDSVGLGPWLSAGEAGVFPSAGNLFARSGTVRSAVVGASPVPMTVTIDAWAGSSALGLYAVSVFAIPNTATDWLNQAPGFAYAGSVATATAALAAAPDPAVGRPVAVFVHESSGSSTWSSPAAGWTLIQQTAPGDVGVKLISAQPNVDAPEDGSVAQSHSSGSVYFTAGTVLDLKSTGRVKVWVDGDLVIDHTGRTHHDGMTRFGASWGIYGTLLSPTNPAYDLAQVLITDRNVTPMLTLPQVPALNPATGAVDVPVIVPPLAVRAWLARSTDGGSTWALAGEYDVAEGPMILSDFTAPLAQPFLRYEVAFDTGPMTELSVPAPIGGDIATPIGSWYLITPTRPELSIPVDVAQFHASRPRSFAIADGPDETVVVSGPDLGRRIQVEFRAKTAAEREALDAALTSGEELRLVSILGRSWWCKPGSDIDERMLKWMALPTEITTLRDAHTLAVTLVQTRRN